MSGQPGRSGGKRPGAGRPVASRMLRTGQRILYQEITADDQPCGRLEQITVDVVSRTKIVLRHEDGSQTILGY